MKKIFTHENRMIVFNMKNLLQGEGIDSFVINEFAAGGAGDLATFDTWPELWIEDDARVQQAEHETKIHERVLPEEAAGH